MEKKHTFFQMFNRIQQASSWPGPCVLLVIVYKHPLDVTNLYLHWKT